MKSEESHRNEPLISSRRLVLIFSAHFQRSVGDLETTSADLNLSLDPQLAPKLKIMNERATLLKITSNAMINACSQYLELTQTQVRQFSLFSVTKVCLFEPHQQVNPLAAQPAFPALSNLYQTKNKQKL